ncbi:hypothetical protein Purlil1_2857 [Purpureocillium lilacinum]|uniref:Uncharacterized protein n=1 Tax=Purpureocillium lilacinum TaxID=33203 RepID=A0ABR0C967_PURLI|nr:hypothetical protein Purlil1_2857 [Purpureocillium lilacinum]
MDEVARLRKRRRVCSGGRGVGDVGPTGEECITDCRPAAAVGKAIKQASKQAGGTASVTFNARQVWGQRAKVKAKMEGDGRNGRKAGMRARKLKEKTGRLGCLAGLPIHDGIQSHAAVSPVSAVERHPKPPASAVFAAVRAAATRWPPLNTAGAGAQPWHLGSASAPQRQRNSETVGA